MTLLISPLVRHSLLHPNVDRSLYPESCLCNSRGSALFWVCRHAMTVLEPATIGHQELGCWASSTA